MTLRGTVRNGMVELESPGALAEGTSVDVNPTARSPLVRALLKHSVTDPATPKDFASELDHYVHGTPKRTGKAASKGKSSRAAAKVAKPVTKKRSRSRGS